MKKPVYLLAALTLTLTAIHGAASQPIGDRKSSAPPGPKPALILSPCDIPGVPGKARCGSLSVFEDRVSRKGRKIDLKVVVLPATRPPAAPDPVFVLVGGPGSAATEEAAGFAHQLAAVREKRDIVLVDQRGTGGSHPLNCDLFGPGEDLQRLLGDFLPIEAVRTCRAALEKEADLRLYTTPIAMDDLDDVRAALGYEKVDLAGGSYGTRAALVYMKRHPEHVRAAVLEGVAPTTDHLPLALPRDAQRALDGVLGECAADPACHRSFPNLRSESAAVFARAAPAPAEVPDRATGDPVTVKLSRDIVGEAIRYMTYNVGFAGLVPVVIHEAAGGNFGPLGEFALFGRKEIVASGSLGMYLSVTCAEDLPFIKPGEGEKAAAGTYLGDYRLRQQRAACALWPRGSVPNDFVQPVRSGAPALLIVGEWDPATPPALAEEAARTLPNGRVLVVPHGAHGQEGLLGASCLDTLIGTFLETGSAKDLNVSCVAKVRRPPFALTSPVRKVVPLEKEALARLAGRYAGETVPIEATVEALEGKLRIRLPRERSWLLVPVSSDTFQVVGVLGFFVRFERAEGQPVRLHVMPPGGEEILLTARPVTPGS